MALILRNYCYLLSFVLPIVLCSMVAMATAAIPIFGMCDPTAVPSQCGKNAVCGVLLPGMDVCERGICACQSPDYAPFYFNATDCGLLLRPGDSCTTTNDAAMLIPEFAQCVDGVVTCAPGLVPANGTCDAPGNVKTQPGDPCDDDLIRCHAGLGLECVRSNRLNERGFYCQCKSNLVFKERRCQRAQYGDPCSNDDQCNVIYEEVFSGASRSVCRDGVCVCGYNYVKVGAIIKTPPTDTQLSDMKPSTILGYYCFSSSLSSRLLANINDNCSLALPNTPFDPKYFYCSPGLVCLHCAESGELSRGKCVNMTALYAQSGVVVPTEAPERPLTPSPMTPTPARHRNTGNLAESLPIIVILSTASRYFLY